MKFTKEEKTKLLDYVAINLMKSSKLSILECKRIVNNSILVSKIESSPSFIAHCSMGQLLDMVKKDKQLTCM